MREIKKLKRNVAKAYTKLVTPRMKFMGYYRWAEFRVSLQIKGNVEKSERTSQFLTCKTE